MSRAAPAPTRIAVTGGRGRLAALIADHFRAPAHELALYSRRGGDGFHDLAGLTSGLAGYQVLLHLAWSTLPATSEPAGVTAGQIDLLVLEKILRAIAALPREQRPHFVFFSSGGTVYGNAPRRPSRETDTCQPVGWYGRAKHAAEELVEYHAARHGLVCTILRVSNPYGFPVPADRAQGIIPRAFHCAWSGQPLGLWGDGTARKDFLYYTDFNRGLRAVIEQRLTGTYNLAVGSSTSLGEVIRLIEEITGRRILLEPGPARPWDVQTSLLDNRKFREASGWTPQVSLREGLQLTARELRR